MYTSFDRDPCLVGEVEFFANFVDGSAGQLNSAIEVKLDLDVLLDDLSLSIKEDNRVSFFQVDLVGQESVRNRSGVSNHTTVFDVSGADGLKREDLYYETYTLTFRFK